MLAQPREQPCDLIHAGDDAAGDLGKLSVDLGRSRCRQLLRSSGELPVNIEAAIIDTLIELPDRLFGRRQRL
jgi:hypothetical protein